MKELFMVLLITYSATISKPSPHNKVNIIMDKDFMTLEEINKKYIDVCDGKEDKILYIYKIEDNTIRQWATADCTNNPHNFHMEDYKSKK